LQYYLTCYHFVNNNNRYKSRGINLNIWNCRESPKQQFEGVNMAMNAVLTLWELCQPPTFITNSIHERHMTTYWLHQWLCTDFISSCKWFWITYNLYSKLPKTLGNPYYKICILNFCCISRSNREVDSVIMLAST
jgi:hypothetical protein